VSATTEHIFIKALSLPSQARAALAQRLLGSLEHEDVSIALDEAAKQEAWERCHAHDTGQLPERDGDLVKRDLARELKGRAFQVVNPNLTTDERRE
jgi:hypothetical protein